jgi:hypothetical protein
MRFLTDTATNNKILRLSVGGPKRLKNPGLLLSDKVSRDSRFWTRRFANLCNSGSKQQATTAGSLFLKKNV